MREASPVAKAAEFTPCLMLGWDSQRVGGLKIAMGTQRPKNDL